MRTVIGWNRLRLQDFREIDIQLHDGGATRPPGGALADLVFTRPSLNKSPMSPRVKACCSILPRSLRTSPSSSIQHATLHCLCGPACLSGSSGISTGWSTGSFALLHRIRQLPTGSRSSNIDKDVVHAVHSHCHHHPHSNLVGQVRDACHPL